MNGHLKMFAAVALVAPVMAGCATKGFVREHVAAEQVRADAHSDSAVSAERSARMSADSSLTLDVASLRKDLDSLRTEYGAKITALESGMQFALPVHFAYNDATIRDEDKAALDRFAKVATKYYPGSKITVEGFADPAGSVKYNLDLSKKRAASVQWYLSSQAGVTDEINAIGYGKTRLVVPNASGDQPGADQNRRVVFVSRASSASSASSISSATSCCWRALHTSCRCRARSRAGASPPSAC
ncbi:MAG: OmpA family protein [Gemmatimonadota bacterium]|nr:OmpA family protein [Gemmatimonadota bacterium]